MPRRRRPLIDVAVAVAAIAAAALAPVLAGAQTLDQDVAQLPDPLAEHSPGLGATSPPNPDSDFDLLAPSLAGNPAKPPRFRRSIDTAGQDQPPNGTFAAPSRIGATPLYGSPPGFGAGDTGFDSKNTPHRKRLAQKPPPQPAPGVETPQTTFEPPPTTEFGVPPKPPAQTPAALPPAQVYPQKAANRPGATLPAVALPLPIDNVPPEVHPLAAANRPGGSVPVPPSIDYDAYAGASANMPPPGTPPLNTLPLGTPAQQPLPIAAGDAYSPVGIRGGSFMFFPAVELSTGYATNPQALPGGPPSAYFVVAPQLLAQSDWSRHSLTANITGTYTDYARDSFTPSLNRPYLNSIIDGRIDVTHDTQVVLENRVIVTTDNPGSPNLTAGLAKLPIDTTVGGTLGLVQNFNRLSVALRGTIDSASYQNSVLTDGESASNADRDFNQYAMIGRVGYELNPGFAPFLQVQEDSRVYAEQFDRYGQARNSTGSSAEVGAKLDLYGSLTGEIAVGYLMRDYIAPLPAVSGAIANGALIWQATPLTTAKLTAASVVNESIAQNVSGELSRDISLEVDHAFRRWLIGIAQLGYGRDDYVGITRDDNRYFAAIGMQYILNRSMSVKVQVRQDRLTSTATGVAYNSTSALLGLRLQR